MEKLSGIANLSVAELQKLPASELVEALLQLVRPFKDMSFVDDERENDARKLLMYLLQVKSKLNQPEQTKVHSCFEIMTIHTPGPRVQKKIGNERTRIREQASKTMERAATRNGANGSHTSRVNGEQSSSWAEEDEEDPLMNAPPEPRHEENVAYLRTRHGIDDAQASALMTGLRSLQAQTMPELLELLQTVVMRKNLSLDSARFLITTYYIQWQVQEPLADLMDHFFEMTMVKESDEEDELDLADLEDFLSKQKPDTLSVTRKRKRGKGHH